MLQPRCYNQDVITQMLYPTCYNPDVITQMLPPHRAEAPVVCVQAFPGRLPRAGRAGVPLVPQGAARRQRHRLLPLPLGLLGGLAAPPPPQALPAAPPTPRRPASSPGEGTCSSGRSKDCKTTTMAVSEDGVSSKPLSELH